MFPPSQYESLIDPLVVMFSVPFSAADVLITLFLTDTTLNLQSGVGCILPVGIVVNNAILRVDQTGTMSARRHEHPRRPSGRRSKTPASRTDDHADHDSGPAVAGPGRR